MPLPVGDDLALLVGLFPEHLDLDVGQPRTGLIDHDAADGRARGLGGSVSRGRKEGDVPRQSAIRTTEFRSK